MRSGDSVRSHRSSEGSGGLHSPAPSDLDDLFEAYRTAKARHDAAIADLREAGACGATPDPELVRAQAAAAVEEFEAMAALQRAQTHHVREIRVRASSSEGP
jgi:hypothetical protein